MGSAPWNTVDPIRPAAEILLRLGAVQGTRRSAFDHFVISPCMFHAGTGKNIVPDTAVLSGTNRFFSVRQLDELFALMEGMTRDVAASYGATAELVRGPATLPVVNDAGAVALAAEAVGRIGGRWSRWCPHWRRTTGDYLQEFPGVYVFGGSAPLQGERLPIHNTAYTINEDALCWSAAFFTALACGFLGEK